MTNYVTSNDGNGFLEITPIYNLNIYKGRFLYKTNLPTKNFDEYIDEYLIEYRKFQRNYINKKNVEGYRVKYLLPLQLEVSIHKSKIKALVTSLIEYISPGNKIPYFAYISKGAKGTKYLSIILLDRYYFPNGRVIQAERPNTRIVDEAGKIIAKDKYDPLKHTLKWNKGDLYEKKIIMSDKLRLDDIFTQGINTELFSRRIAHIKKKLVYEVNRIFGIKLVHVKSFLKKLTYKQRIETNSGWIHVDKRQVEYDKSYYYRRRKVRIINDYIDVANEMLSSVTCNDTATRISEAIKKQIDEVKKIRMVNDIENILKSTDLLYYFL